MKTINSLVVQFIPLAESIACKFYKKHKNIALDEFKSAAYYALVLAAHKHQFSNQFNPTKRITGSCLDYIRFVSHRKSYKTKVKFVALDQLI